ncbi:hypothetical protein VMCG_10195 [Cytospora schulzeri]|uniref:DUF1993 domain-containing protein n=1 Tax=Cytospora schulzeri TaxID=448051 RepID=A0A423VD02_9PEZI|nr:hypothetical protein VMCG_10195 [Valsa malicola]
MAGITFYDAYFPILIQSMDSLESILVKAQTYAKENGIDADAEYVPAKLYEDMKTLPFQVQIASTMVKRCVTRLTGAGAEEWKDDETTLEQLLARVRKTSELVKSVRPEDVNGKEDDVIDVQVGYNTTKMPSKPYVTFMVMPNLFFHIQTAYSILRMKGVPLGKRDFLTAFMGSYMP